jgi:hypothetical protein
MAQQTATTAPELTDEEALAELERRVAAMEAGALRHSWEQLVSIEKNRRRCRAIEEATRVKLPPDTNRWRISGLPPPASAPAEPSPQRPSGWRPLDPVRTPYVDACDRLMDAADARDKAARVKAEVEYRQYLIDEAWERKLADEQQRRKQAERSCHVGPGDPDFNER